MLSMKRSIVLALFSILSVGCAGTPGEGEASKNTGSSYSNEQIFFAYQNTLDLKQEKLYVEENGTKRFVGTRTTAHSIFKPSSTDLKNKDSVQSFFYHRGLNARSATTWLTVVGHTDSSGNSETNFKLSKKRAFEIASLTIQAGPNLKHYYQFGDYLPAYPNNTKQGRAKNRRIELLEFNSEDDLNLYMNQYYFAPFDTELAARKKQVEKQDAAKASSSKSSEDKNLNKKVKRRTGQFINFAGTPFGSSSNDIIAVLQPLQKSSFNIFKKAVAADVSNACLNDTPPSETKDIILKTSEYYPLMNRTSWWAIVNGHGVLVTPVGVAKDDAEPVSSPTIYVYKDYQPDAKPTHKYPADVVVYEGKDHLLYRVFPRDISQSVQCIDILLSKKAMAQPPQATRGKIYYDTKTGIRVANYLPIKG
ncbi:hypothetical protein A1OQ_21670 [Enterovibrio norvegicus FF-162]|uniref:OmpA family protein n=1 Tax=Enterovibrio norvegicus TaxID=188144 RepID=UPI0002F92F25|nr:OmpA family protein [Enterovibrio norvegicus]OEE78647.1 hypothetical protein A1OQ_21670 [Enterovibrio norvegicus FF-162]